MNLSSKRKSWQILFAEAFGTIMVSINTSISQCFHPTITGFAMQLLQL